MKMQGSKPQEWKRFHTLEESRGSQQPSCSQCLSLDSESHEVRSPVSPSCRLPPVCTLLRVTLCHSTTFLQESASPGLGELVPCWLTCPVAALPRVTSAGLSLPCFIRESVSNLCSPFREKMSLSLSKVYLVHAKISLRPKIHVLLFALSFFCL